MAQIISEKKSKTDTISKNAENERKIKRLQRTIVRRSMENLLYKRRLRVSKNEIKHDRECYDCEMKKIFRETVMFSIESNNIQNLINQKLAEKCKKSQIKQINKPEK
ncbi:hypothetical protein MHBO_000356 [Bonamia ostreae]|uniref:Uncharacterized protein n=1 Tax=Bonamia ostreae TaxID=126728 RepID=A0ABV2AFE8_9EUKA